MCLWLSAEIFSCKLVFDLEYQVLYFKYKIDIYSLTAPTNAHFYHYVFHSYLSATCFGLTAIIRELTPILLKLAGINYSYNAYSYQEYRL